ncbi:TonB-dependent receptor domain-containing protein [Psychroflexus salis]|uniref:TonB-dependent receptor n=1 Tax=Psychroflexus salis TaxID=1526574 RepID=A0A917E866_9FLAO|nr:TonB-dependent receptor [Psychroflexus salis]GGE12782.1 TonB-dependent receptor [Psychroflexus salis]
MKYFIGLFLCLLVSISYAQEYEIKGKVIDDQGIPLEMASVKVIPTNNPEDVKGSVTDFDGNFSIKVDSGTYHIEVEFISFETKKINNKSINKDTNLGTISLQFAQQELDEVNVVYETTQVDVRLDKKIYNVGKDLTTAGGTVSEALANVPSVTVDVDGAISLRGNANVRILINGKPSSVAGFGDQDVFQQLPADAIESVEVITSPSARYDAEGSGGIINIILKREKTLGINGSFRGTIGDPRNTGAYTNINLRTDKFNIFNNLGYTDRKGPGNAFYDNQYPGNPNFDRIIENRKYDRSGENFNMNTGVEYFFDETSSLTASFFMRLGDDLDRTRNRTTRFLNQTENSTTLRTEEEAEDDKRFQYALNYEKRFDPDNRDHKLTADFQYSNKDETKDNRIFEDIISPSTDFVARQNVFETEDEKSFLIQADYVLPIGETQFEAGFRGDYSDAKQGFLVNRKLAEDAPFTLNDSLSSTFNFQQNITAVYSQYGDKLGDKFSFLLGLRFEQTQLKGETIPVNEENFDQNFNFDKTFNGLFPTVNLIYEIGEEENISLGYNRRINRPRSWFLNPFPSQSSRTNIFQGNPDLDPAFANAFDLGYLKQWEQITLTGSVYYQRETESFERVQRDTGRDTAEDGIDIIENIPINLSTEERYGAELGLLYNPAKWLRTNLSFNYFRFESDGEFEGIEYGATNESYFGRFSANVILPWDIQWQTNAFYRGPRENAQTKTDPIASLDLAFSKDILNEKATISLNVRDLFNSRVRDQFTVTPNFISDSEFQWRERQVTLTFVYRFNQPKDKRRGSGGGGYDDDDGY